MKAGRDGTWDMSKYTDTSKRLLASLVVAYQNSGDLIAENITHTLDARYGKCKLELNLELPPYCSAFIVTEDSMHTAGRAVNGLIQL